MPVFTCQGIPGRGVILTPPSAPEFPYLLEAIRTRTREKIDGAPPAPDIDAVTPEELECSAVLLNYSNKTIRELALRWTFESSGARPRVSSRIGLLGQSEILPMGPRHPLLAYWNVIMPGSVRLITREHMYGNNLDIRSPRPEELHHGGWMQIKGGAIEPMNATTVDLALDGVLFEGGEFTGEDKSGILWNLISAEVDLKSETSALAKKASEEGRSAEEALARVLEFLGEGDAAIQQSAPDSDPQGYQRQRLRQYLVLSRDHGEAAQAVQALLHVADLPRPLIRRT